MAADERGVVIGCRDPLDQRDLFRCYDLEHGTLLWQVEYDAAGSLDYGNTPRATPLIAGDLVYVLGAFGDLSCIEQETGAVLWRRHLVRDLGGSLPTWGFCGSPLAIDGRVVVQPGGEAASLVALDGQSGDVLWQSPGHPASYSSMVVAEFGGRQQVVGFDNASLGGWDPASGQRLWEYVPPVSGDFNVPTPIVDESGVLFATENNGAIRLDLGADGVPRPEPAATFASFNPDTHTPVRVGDRLFGVLGRCFCLQTQTLQPIWFGKDPAFEEFCTLLASDDVVLVITLSGELVAVDARADRLTVLSRAHLPGGPYEVHSHPAWIGRRLLIRLGTQLACFEFAPE